MITELHSVRTRAGDGCQVDAGTLARLEDAISSTSGPFLCDGTPHRWRLHLAGSRMLLGDVDRAVDSTAEIAKEAAAMRDVSLARQAVRLLFGLGARSPLDCETLSSPPVSLRPRAVELLGDVENALDEFAASRFSA
jgi:hypothetical protein